MSQNLSAMSVGYPAPLSSPAISRLRFEITGAVQGVGFRPFIFRLAQQLFLNGWVRNDCDGVIVEVEGTPARLEAFRLSLERELPQAAVIDSLLVRMLPPCGDTEFRIVISATPDAITPTPSLLPDLASCPDCINEVNNPADRRYRYPFTSCTSCGPRWSIVYTFPYDRANTTMADFKLCPACRREYEDPSSRRFHHQANACPDCGPVLVLRDVSGKVLVKNEAALSQAIDHLRQGLIVAIKGIGGYQLLVDAHNNEAVSRLRHRKQRPGKPLAIMCPDIHVVATLCEMNNAERDLLLSPAAPIVLLRRKPDSDGDKPLSSPLAFEIAPDNPYLGVMLPYTILHRLVVQGFGASLVCTSGNLSDEPLCIDDNEAVERLGFIADFFLSHNRGIAAPLDDSITQIVMDKPMILRRARGYVPRPLIVKNVPVDSPAVLAVGGHLKNTVAISHDTADSGKISISAHIGDLDSLPAREELARRVNALSDIYRLRPQLLVHDLHPDYGSSLFAESFAKTRGIPRVGVQHHFAHVAACKAEHGLDGKVLGIVWDGAGLGDDGTIWGGEFLLADYRSYERLGHLMIFPLIGGDRAARDNRLAALGVLWVLFEGDAARIAASPLAALFDTSELNNYLRMLKASTGVTYTSSAGRLFDAAACLLGLCNHSRFEGEAAMRLQFAAEASGSDDCLALPFVLRDHTYIVDWRPLLLSLLDGIKAGRNTNDLARLFHLSLAQVSVELLGKLTEVFPGIKTVLTGGCFQNRLLLSLIVQAMKNRNLPVYWPQSVPTNDGGLSLGQLMIGLHSTDAFM